MEPRTRSAFFHLLLAQAAHSVEEYVTGLYDVFPPARAVSALVSDDLATGFAVVNATLVGFGLWCWAVPLRAGWPSARALAWGWALLELANGVGHVGLAVARGRYFPGALTAPLIVLLAARLALLLSTRLPRPS